MINHQKFVTTDKISVVKCSTKATTLATHHKLHTW